MDFGETSAALNMVAAVVFVAANRLLVQSWAFYGLHVAGMFLLLAAFLYGLVGIARDREKSTAVLGVLVAIVVLFIFVVPEHAQ